MFREGIHRARIKHINYTLWLEGMVEYISDSCIYLYSNTLAFNGTKSDKFKKNSYGYRYCFLSNKNYLADVIYTDHNYIGEL